MAPFHIMVKPAGPVCNLECAYCYYLRKDSLYPPHENFRMRADVLERLIANHIASSTGPHVDFAWQGGEPTIMGLDFFRQVVAVQQRHLPAGWTCANAIQTNGTMLDDEWGAFLKAHRFLVGISIDGPAELHDRHRVDKRGRPTHGSVLRGLRVLQRHGVEHNVLCVVHGVNSRHPLQVYRFLRGAGVTWMQFIPLVERAEGRATERSVTAEGYGDFLVAIFDEWVRNDVGRIFIQLFEECAAVWSGLPASLCVLRETCGDALVVEHNGDVYACDHFVLPEYRRGNVATLDLGAMADTPAQRDFGAAKRDTLPRACRECDVRFICQGGCPKDRFDRTEDGEPGLNHLCRGYARFFRHVDPAMRRLAALVAAGENPARIMAQLRREGNRGRAVGRNDPCPCGSGRKHKHCCLAAPRGWSPTA